MTLLEILTLAEQDSPNLYQFEEETSISYADQIQKMAYRKDLEAFKVWDKYIRIFHTLTFDPNDYSVVASDIGKTVIGATSGAEGELIDYDEDAATYLVYVTTGEFEADEVVAVQAGTGTGTLTDTEIFLGPYNLTTHYGEDGLDPACRKLVGVTTYTDAEIFGTTPQYLSDLDDYGEIISRDMDRDFYHPGRVNAVYKTFTFVDTPSLETNYYRWIYYLQPPAITESDSEVLIPEEFHHTLLLQGIIALQDNALAGDRFVIPSQILKPYLDEFWEAMGDQHLDVGDDNHRRIGW